MKTLLATAALALLTTAAHAGDYGCAVIRPNSDGWLAVRSGPGTQYHINRKLLSGRTVYVERKEGVWQFINTVVTKNGTTEEVEGWVYSPLLRSVDCEDGCNRTQITPHT